MTLLLVTGSQGGDNPHVTSAMDGIMHAGMLGAGGYLLKTRKWAEKPVAKDSNHITIPAWDMVLEGRQMMVDTATDVTIQSGSQGMKRSDLIVARYTMNASTGVESCSLVALKGTPAASSPADPSHNTGSIIGGAIVSDLPLCRVNLDGINITGVDTLVNVLAPLSDVWDSLTQSGEMKLNPGLSGIFKELDPLTWARVGNIVQLGGSVRLVGSWNPMAPGNGDRVIVDLPFEFDGYQQNSTWATNGRLNTLRMDANSLRLTGTGGISDWPVGTNIYLQSTWIVKDK